LCDASLAAREKGFMKEDDGMWSADDDFIGGHQIEFYNIKPLLRALIIVINKRIDEPTPSKPKIEPDFAKQEVRLVRTGVTTGLTQPITFAGLSVLEEINENEVVTTLPEAIRFVMQLDEREEAGALRERKDDTIMDHWLGLPKVQIERYFSKPNGPRHRFWTG
jgi:hypothetical protein